MKGDLPAAALRLCAELPVRTHIAPERPSAGQNHANNVRPVIIDGMRYDSLTEAARQIGKGREALRKRIYKGTARYA